ncbi:MAG: alpha/beta fold hydrolase [Desulforhopalus sp.]
MFPDYPFTSRFLNINTHRLHYIDEGKGPPIVMVHGNPTWSFYYRKLISSLQSRHRVIAYDHMGCGLSDKPNTYPYCLDKHIENLERLLDHLEIERFSLVMHDWGGAIGLGCAVKRAECIDRVVVMNSAAFRSRRMPLRIRLCRTPIFGQIIVRLFNGFAWPAQFMAVVKRMAPETAAAYLAPYDSWRNRVAIFRFVEDIPMSPHHRSYDTLVGIEQGLPGLNKRHIPFLILWGGKDFCFNDHFYKQWQKHFPAAEKHYFCDGGHYILEDKFEDIEPIVQSFLER